MHPQELPLFLPPEVARQGGRFTYQQGRASGWTSYRLDRAVRAGLLIETTRGVFAVAVHTADPVQTHADLVRDIQLSSRKPWFAARRSAALLMQLPIIGRPPAHAQMVREGYRGGAQGRDRHLRVSPLHPADRWEYAGIAMTTGARTVADIARAESFRNGVVVADAALRRGVPREELEQCLARMKSWPGIRRARDVVGFADGRSESPGESVTRVAALFPGIPKLLPQVEIWSHGSFVARVDFLIEGCLLGVEFDGALKFDGDRVLPDLLRRGEAIRDAGVDIIRTFWDEVFVTPEVFQRRLLARVQALGPRRLPRSTELRPSALRLQAPLLGRPMDFAA